MTVVLFTQTGMKSIHMQLACSTQQCLSTDDHKFMFHIASVQKSTVTDYKVAQENGDTILTAWQGSSSSVTGSISVIKFQKISYKDDWLPIAVSTIAQTLNSASNAMRLKSFQSLGLANENYKNRKSASIQFSYQKHLMCTLLRFGHLR